MITKEGERKLAVYIHLPFCVRKCQYCDFVSGVYPEETQKNYVNRLLQEIDWVFEEENAVITSVFFGGGTPSVLPPEYIEKILCKLKENAEFRDAEITIEVNPGTVSDEGEGLNKLEKYKRMGINRISIGMQSVNNEELQTLGRIHTFEDFKETFESARRAGFGNISVDVMYALPGQDYASFEHSLRTAASLRPEHISAYSLIIEENTPFEGRDFCEEGIPLPDEEEERKMYASAGRILEEYGYHQYEISNYALDGFECRHNTVYWERGEYLGFGIAAASLTYPEGDTAYNAETDSLDRSANRTDYPCVRYTNTGDIRTYLQAESLDGLKKIRTDREILSKESAMSEFAFLGLRMNRGIDGNRFREVFGESVESVFGEAIDRHIKNGLLTKNEQGNYCLTERGRDVANTVMADFI